MPSGETANADSPTFPAENRRSSRPVSMSHTRTVESAPSPHEAERRPSAKKATPVTASVCPSNFLVSAPSAEPASITPSRRPRSFHTLASSIVDRSQALKRNRNRRRRSDHSSCDAASLPTPIITMIMIKKNSASAAGAGIPMTCSSRLISLEGA